MNVEPIRWSAPLHAYLVREIPGLLRQKEVQPLQFIEIEDLEALLSLIGPPSISDLIAAKLQAIGSDPDIQQWFFNDPTMRKADRPATVTEHLDRAVDAAVEALGLDPAKLAALARNASR